MDIPTGHRIIRLNCTGYERVLSRYEPGGPRNPVVWCIKGPLFMPLFSGISTKL